MIKISKQIKIAIFIIIFFVVFITPAFAEEAYITNGLNYLRSKQDDSGKITTGFSAPSQWSAIAFSASNTDVATVKKTTNSLKDFLLTDIPINNSATEYETRVLAIVAIGADPTNFNNTNYVHHVESFYTHDQLGDTCSLNDDIFGLLSLIAANSSSSAQIQNDTLNFLITNQDGTDGGFGFSAPGCDWYSTSADMTAAGLQALVAARDHGITHAGLDTAIEKAKQYLLSNQNVDGGFGYFGSSDTDTTGWVLIGLNVLNMTTSEQGLKAKEYLLSQQAADGGFLAYDYTTSSFASNATTTAQALIALSGKSWILTIFDPEITVSETTRISTPSPTTTTIIPTPTPSSLTSIDQNTILYKTLTITTTPFSKRNITKNARTQNTQVEKEVLGKKTGQPKKKDSYKTITILSAHAKNPGFLAIGLGSICIAGYFWIKRRARKNSADALSQ